MWTEFIASNYLNDLSEYEYNLVLYKKGSTIWLPYDAPQKDVDDLKERIDKIWADAAI